MNNTYGPGFRNARTQALRRSQGVCQFCGQRPATQGHHWATHYPRDDDITASVTSATWWPPLSDGSPAPAETFPHSSPFSKEQSRNAVLHHYRGHPPHHHAQRHRGLDVRSPANIEKAEIAAKKGFNRTVVDEEKLRQLDCETSLWLDESLAPTIPPSAIRAVIESGARKLRQGPLVREGLVVVAVESFDYDRDRYGTTLEELSKTTQFTTAVVVQRSRILRTRARFDEWSSAFVVDVDDELVDQAKLDHWLDIGGRRIGPGRLAA